MACLLADAIADKKKLLIVADYDADGATACAVAMRGLGALGARVDFIVPNRFEYGYGLTPEIVRLAKQIRTGHSAHGGQRHRQRRRRGRSHAPGHASTGDRPSLARRYVAGCAVHRQPQPARLHLPQQKSGGCGRDVLRADGVAGGDAQARCSLPIKPNPIWATCSTSSRSAPWRTWSNWTTTTASSCSKACSASAPDASCAGIQALLRVARRPAAQASAYELGFIVGPRLNAAGRLEDMALGIRCLLTDDAA